MYGSIPFRGGCSSTHPQTELEGETTSSNNNRIPWSTSRKSILYVGLSLIGAATAFVSVPLKGSAPKVESLLLAMPESDADSPMPVSRRAQSLKAVRDDLDQFFRAANDPYHPSNNPDGYLVMLVAENKLMWKEMAAKIQEVQASTPLPEWIFNYGDPGGEIKFRESMGKMMERWIHAPIDPQYLRFQAGASSVLDQVSYLLTDTNDGVLVLGPGYPAFTADFAVYGSARVHVTPADAKNGYVPTIDELDKGFETAVAAGNPPRILVICQPNNPTGTVYSKEAMYTMVEWALSKGLHVLSDEIYALSTLPGYSTTSAADVMRDLNPTQENYLGDYVHIVAGLSKDWGMSGFRVGSLFTHNADLLRTFDLVDFYQSVSFYTQHVLTGVFEDQEFVDHYIAENRRRLYETYQALEESLKRIDVPLIPAQGTIFAWADFSNYLKEGQTEKELWMELFDDAKIALTTGESCFGEKPGMFRIVYAWPEGGPEAMREFGRRLVQWKTDRAA